MFHRTAGAQMLLAYHFRGIDASPLVTYSWVMSQIAATMPEAKHRSTKQRAQQARSTMQSQHQHASRQVAAAVATAQVAAAGVAVAAPVKAKKVEKKSLGDAIAAWWPVAAGIFLAGFAAEWHAMAIQAGVWMERFTFPLTLLAAHRESGLDDQMAMVLPQAALYLQLPLEGLLTMLTLARGQSLKVAVLQLVSIHAVCALVLWLLSLAAN
jgi:hypothetical protein